MRHLFLVALLLIAFYSCRKDKAIEPVTPAPPTPVALDYRDSVTGVYTCEDHWSYTGPSGSATGIDTVALTVTKDSASSNQVIVWQVVNNQNIGTTVPLDSSFYHNGNTGSTFNELRFVINTANGDSLYWHYGFISPGSQNVHQYYGLN